MPADLEGALRAWLRFDGAIARVNARLSADHGLTGAQLGMLRLVDEFGGRPSLTEMRERLSLHPATLGQFLARLADKGLVELVRDDADLRRRIVQLTPAGEKLLAEAPVVGPVRLRRDPPDAATLEAIANGFDAALDAFGLTPYAHPERKKQ